MERIEVIVLEAGGEATVLAESSRYSESTSVMNERVELSVLEMRDRETAPEARSAIML